LVAATAVTTAGECREWVAFPGVNSIGGTHDVSLAELGACQMACFDQELCVAVDWDSGSGESAGCWLHHNADNLLRQYNAPNVTQYQLTRCGSTTTSTTTTTTTTTPTSTYHGPRVAEGDRLHHDVQRYHHQHHHHHHHHADEYVSLLPVLQWAVGCG